MDNVRLCAIDEALSLCIAAFEAAARVGGPVSHEPSQSTPSPVLIPDNADDTDYFSTTFDALFYFRDNRDDDIYVNGELPLHVQLLMLASIFPFSSLPLFRSNLFSAVQRIPFKLSSSLLFLYGFPPQSESCPVYVHFSSGDLACHVLMRAFHNNFVLQMILS